MTWMVVRTDKDPDGTARQTVVDFTDDEAEIGVIMDIDRDKIDWDAQYTAIPC